MDTITVHGATEMAKRLITLHTIRKEKLDRSRSWILARDDFPAPTVPGNPNLWDEDAIDAWVAKFIAASAQKPQLPTPRRSAARA